MNESSDYEVQISEIATAMSNMHPTAVLVWLRQLRLSQKSVFRKLRANIHARGRGYGIQDFVAIRMAELALQFCSIEQRATFKHEELQRLYFSTLNVLLTDPITDDTLLEWQFQRSHYFPLLMRIVRSQNAIGRPWGADLARPTLMWADATEYLPTAARFHDPRTAFFDATGVRFCEYLSFAFTAIWRAAIQKDEARILSRYQFLDAANRGIIEASPQAIRASLDLVVGDKHRFYRFLCLKSPRDGRFQRYRRSPLARYPIVRPDGNSKYSADPRKDALIFPVPLLAKRLVTHLPYTLLRAHYGHEFTTFFGHLFSAYVGLLLKKIPNCKVLDEDELVAMLPSYSGKRPDWALFDGKTLLLIECKGSQFPDYSLLAGNDDDLRKKLTKIVKSRNQLETFLETFRQDGRFASTLTLDQDKASTPQYRLLSITWDWYPMLNSIGGKEYLEEIAAETGIKFREPSWVILSILELELLHSQIERDANLANLFDPEQIIENVREQQQRKEQFSQDSFLGRQIRSSFDRFINI